MNIIQLVKTRDKIKDLLETIECDINEQREYLGDVSHLDIMEEYGRQEGDADKVTRYAVLYEYKQLLKRCLQE
jgi:hypothetical protein